MTDEITLVGRKLIHAVSEDTTRTLCGLSIGRRWVPVEADPGVPARNMVDCPECDRALVKGNFERVPAGGAA